jgi:transglutaminase-like putative cysteine protease
MTTTPAANGAPPSVVDRLRGLLSMPDEGWSALVAVFVLMLVVGVAVDDPRWVDVVPGTKLSRTAWLPVCVGLAVLVGYVLGRSRVSTLKAHLIGAVIGAAYLLVAVSASISSLPSIDLRLHALSQSVATFMYDVTVRGVRSAETSVFMLLVGGLLWSAGYLGTFALFRRHRAGPAITLAATALLINMSITVNDQLVFLVVLVAAALLLVVRTSLYGQLEQWRSRRIADSGYASQLFVRSGVAFVVTAIALSLVLAVNASSAPLRPMWDQAVEHLVEVGIEVNHFIGGVTGEARGPNLLFTPSQTLRDQWETSNEQLFTAVTDDRRAYRWRGATYEFFDGSTWHGIGASTAQVPAFADLQAGAATDDAGLTAGRHQVLTEITAVEPFGRTIVAPGDPLTLSQAATVQTNASHGLLNIKLDSEVPAKGSYVVTSRVFSIVGSQSLTVADLAGASVNYAAYGDFTPYVDIEPNAIGPVTRSVAQDIVNSLDPAQRDPYHIADAMTRYLHDGNGFRYTPDVRGMCTGEIIVDCFLREKAGFCERYATALTMMLRTQLIPARYVTGFLPGEEHEFVEFDEDNQPQTVTERIVLRSSAHAWVEVYFPGYGWYPFDPTPGLGDSGLQEPDLAPGSLRPSPSSSAPAQTPNFGSSFRVGVDVPPPAPTNPSASASGVPTSLAVGVFLAVLAAAALLIVFARRRRLPTGGQLTFDSVAKMATRFGYGPQPSQTAYEYANSLALVVPAVRDELRVVATAKVESVYAKREPSDELKLRLLVAYRRVRLSLVRLFVRRPHWIGPRWRH